MKHSSFTSYIRPKCLKVLTSYNIILQCHSIMIKKINSTIRQKTNIYPRTSLSQKTIFLSSRWQNIQKTCNAFIPYIQIFPSCNCIYVNYHHFLKISRWSAIYKSLLGHVKKIIMTSFQVLISQSEYKKVWSKDSV